MIEHLRSDALAVTRAAIARLYRADERAAVEALMPAARVDPAARARIASLACELIASVRERARHGGGIEQFLQEYKLSTPEGITLLGLAEAFLRVPDAPTADRLIRDKLGAGDWEAHLGRSPSPLVNASTRALVLTQHVLGEPGKDGDIVGRLIAAGGEPLVRQAVGAAMRIMGGQFVLGRTIEEALRHAGEAEAAGFRYSYDMLGEGARTRADADHHFDAYCAAIAAIGRATSGPSDLMAKPNISVKLSALHPRYEASQAARVGEELGERLLAVAVAARDAGIGLTVDAEEAERLELSLDVIEHVARAPEIGGWGGLGLAVQAYQKRALPVIEWANALGAALKRRFLVRLVKGAYWDTEIKRTQERGLAGYPVFTRKTATDLSYLACARALLNARNIYPAFATHNALTVATVLDWIGTRRDLEFQRLHGMGEGLYEPLIARDGIACRIYAPVGVHRDLLAYLVRRLLENGANSSFVNRVADPATPIQALIADPVETTERNGASQHPRIPLPADLYGPGRRNSRGFDLSDAAAVSDLRRGFETAWGESHEAAPIVGGKDRSGQARAVTDPSDRHRIVGHVVEATPAHAREAVAAAANAADDWSRRPVEDRARCLERMADLLEDNRVALMALAVREAGKTIADAVAEVREAVDYCRYYALEARRTFGPRMLPGPTGESNQIALAGRGAFACVSPWNFPLAIFLGQVSAALVAGNAVVAKPAPQTPLIAARAVRLFHRAGVPTDVLHLVPGGADVGQALVDQPEIRGIAFTGSTGAARTIARVLAARDGPIPPLIAETGGINAMIVDSSALPERVVDDVVASAFQSAGQRCSALRILYLQEEAAPRVLDMLAGAIDQLVVGDPGRIETDVGPVIDERALARLQARLSSHTGTLLHRGKLGADCAGGWFLAPHLIALDSPQQLREEVFGPILHVVRWQAGHLDRVVDTINATGYGLTLGVHTRIGATVEQVRARARVGNLYVNRSMIGAVVGVQPFGGEGLSGTGPKAGGPHYLSRFATERTVSVDTTIAGGNASLMAMDGSGGETE